MPGTTVAIARPERTSRAALGARREDAHHAPACLSVNVNNLFYKFGWRNNPSAVFVTNAQRRYSITLAADYIERSNLRIEIQRFDKELLRSERRTVGRLDGRFTGIDEDAAVFERRLGELAPAAPLTSRAARNP